LLECNDRRSELNQAFLVARDLLKGRWADRSVGAFQPGEIAMLYPNAASQADRALLEEYADWMNSKGVPCSWLSRDYSSRDEAANDRLKIQTIHSAKGLQYRAVIILWADKLPRSSSSPDGRLRDRRLLYVAMTRAVSLLAITASGRSAFVREIGECPAVEVAQTTGVPQRASSSEPQPLARPPAA
jgi:ATP-dependent exoDNAse (exonuclease V) beta subunit